MIVLKQLPIGGTHSFTVLFNGTVMNKISLESLYEFIDANVLIHFNNGERMDVNDFLGEDICKLARSRFN